MNTRIAPRKNWVTPIYFEDENENDFLYFNSENISASGVLLRTDIRLKAHVKVFLKFYIPNDSKPIRTTAVVTRQHTQKRGPGPKQPIKAGVGLKFTGLSPSDFMRLQDFISQDTL